MEKTFKSLINEFEKISELGWVESTSYGSSGVGMTFEKLLGKAPDDFALPDYNDIEIKTQRIDSNYPVTLFGLAPWGSHLPAPNYLRKNYGYYDTDPEEKRKLNVEFYHSKNILIHNRYFFNLDIDYKEEKVYLIVKDIKHNVIDKSVYWFFDDIKEKLNTKLKYLGFVHAKAQKYNGKEYFKYFKIECYTLKNLETFLQLLEKNIICVSIVTSPYKYGPSVGNYKASCYFRIGKFDLNRLFNLVYTKNYYDDSHY